MSGIMFQRVAFIGFGLIGSSLARVIRRDRLAAHIAVCARTQGTLQAAKRLKLADSATLNIGEAASGADLVLIAAPLGAYKAIAKAMAPALKKGCIVSDAGSAKQMAIGDIKPYLPKGVHLVPAHPVAGTEHSGPEAGFAELFEGHWCILTPPRNCAKAAVAKVAKLWRHAGMTIEIMDARHHDQVLAITSHLPHMIAYTIVDTATSLESHLKQEVIKFSAGGFRDFTRIAASDPIMWRDICLANKEAILEIMNRFTKDLETLAGAIRKNDGDWLRETFTRTREIRRGVIKAKQERPEIMKLAGKKKKGRAI